MFNIGTGEIALIAIAALLILGPKRLPELARGIGKFMREFRRQTDDIRSVVEREFYRMDQEVQAPAPEAPPAIVAANPVPHGADEALPPAEDMRSQVLQGAPDAAPAPEPVVTAPTPEGQEPGKS